MDTDALQRTLDAIDAVTTCGWCAAPLTANSPSPNYCSEEHQERWHAHRHEPKRRNLDVPAPLCQLIEEYFEQLAPEFFHVQARGTLAERTLDWNPNVYSYLARHESRDLFRNITVA